MTLPALREAGVCAQVFASWAWGGRYGDDAGEVGERMVQAVGELCRSHPEDLLLALSGRDVEAACLGGAGEGAAGTRGPTAVIASLEGADPLMGEAGNLGRFYEGGVRLVTLAWGDNAFCGTVFGAGGGLTAAGRDLVAVCEELGVLVDVSHASDQAFIDVCAVATKPFIASHSNCRALCPNDRNLSDGQIRRLAERGGVLGINLGSAFLSPDYYAQSRAVRDEFFRSVAAGERTADEAGEISTAATAGLARPPLSLAVDHVLHAVAVGGEDCVGLGGDLDGVDSLADGIDGVADYPKIAELLEAAGLSPVQVEKVCWGNMARVFREVVV